MENQVVKVGVIVEGQTEAVLVRRLLELKFSGIVKIIMVRLGAGGNSITPKGIHGIDHQNPQYVFTVIDAQGEGGVIPAFESEGKRLLDSGNKYVLGLRDMYCEEYDQKSGGKINNTVIRQLEEKANSTVSIIDNSGRLRHFYSIMEVETWFLAIPGVLEKVHATFSENEIMATAGITQESDYEKIYHPSAVMQVLYRNVNEHYKKSNSCTMAITSKIDQEDVDNVVATGRIPAFKKFYSALVAT